MAFDDTKARVLVISSSPFSKTRNNGKTLASFLEGYGAEYIAQFSFSGGDCNKEVCDNYFFYTKEDIISKNNGRACRADEISVDSSVVKASNKSFPHKVFHYFSQKRLPITIYLKNRLWEKADYSKAFAWIESFAPQVVFFQGFSMSYGYGFALNVCKKYDLPMILELTDDYTHNLYPVSILERINKKKYMKVFTEAVRCAYKTIVISDAMKEEYTAMYGGDMVVMMNSVPEISSIRTARVAKDYVYAGNVLLNRWKVLRNFGIALARVDPEATLTVYTPDEPPQRALRAFSKVSSIKYGGRLTKEELSDRLSKCEYVVHVEAFDKKNRMITRLSMSTKISEYLACGAKLIAIGPPDVASMSCLKDNQLAICINHHSPNQIAGMLDDAMERGDVCQRNAEEFLSTRASDKTREIIAEYITGAVYQGRK